MASRDYSHSDNDPSGRRGEAIPDTAESPQSTICGHANWLLGNVTEAIEITAAELFVNDSGEGR
jgi:hypothetical protein